MRFFLYIILLISFLACDNNQSIPLDARIEDPLNKEYPGVYEALWPHFERFEREAGLRGVPINLQESGITGSISDIIGSEQIAGSCDYHDNEPNAIVIDLETWAITTDLMHEFIVFHELGHCSLLRGHLDSIVDKGRCFSIMRSSPAVCVDTYSYENRDRFLDELFSK